LMKSKSALDACCDRQAFGATTLTDQ